jgi:mitochondrial cardiolipin hydrolase
MDLIAHLKQSLEDDNFSEAEKNELRLILENQPLDNDAINFLRSRIYELASEKVTAGNYPLVMQWMKDTSNVLQARQAAMSEAFFSPGDTCRNAIIGQINGALHQLKICVFTISDDHITSAIVGAHKRGVAIQIITDNKKSFDVGSDIHLLSKEGIAVKTDGSDSHMHHKFMVADDRSLITGSYNWTSSAARFNHENVLLTTETGVIKSFTTEFDRLWHEMESY